MADQHTPLDPQAIAQKWEEIAPGIAKMMERVGNPTDFPVATGSSLAGDDTASDPYQVSHATRMCLVAGVDHLDAVRALLLDLQVIHNAAPFSLIRGALENLAAAYWILHPSMRNTRIEHALRWHAKNFKDQHKALGPGGESTEAKRDQKLGKLVAIAARRGIPSKDIRAGYLSSTAVDYAESHSQRAKPSLPWQLCSGYAHGRPWAYLGYSEQAQFETTDPKVLNVRLTTDPERLLYPTVVAYDLLIDVVGLLQQRSENHRRPALGAANQ